MTPWQEFLPRWRRSMTEGSDLPSGWHEAPLASIARYSAGRTPARAVREYWTDDATSGVPWVSIADMKAHRTVLETAECITAKAFREVFRERMVPRGSLLMSFKLSIGRIATLGIDALHNEAIVAISPSEGIDQAYLGFYLSQVDFDEYHDRQIKGNTLNRDKIDRIRVAVPPLVEQRKIAWVLQSVQRAIEVQEQLVATAGELKRAAMQQLFTRGLRGEPQMESDVGAIPGGWSTARLGDLARIGNGSTPKRDHTPYWTEGSIPWLTSGKVHEGIIHAADQFVTSTAVEECHLPLVRAGSLVVAITGQGKTLGNAAMVTFDTTVSQHLAYLSFHESGVCASFVRYFLGSKYEHLRSIGQAGGSTKGALTCAELKRYPLPWPPEDEQVEIAAILESLDRKLAHHERKRDTLQDLFKTLLHELMTGRIRVQHLDIDTSGVTEPITAEAVT